MVTKPTAAAAVATAASADTMTAKCRTRVDGTSKEKVVTELTINFDDEKAAREFAKRGIVIAWQALARVAGVIPASDVVSVADLIKRSASPFKATPDSIANKMGKMADDDYRATLVALKLDKATIDKLMKSRG